ncbi:MAG: alpha/beta hydrolase [Rhodoferax sp.]|uniref:alpha/beta hydrolase n=1 Tax=Rhodoferax sp. TaxID=50421 RepID=UPI0026046623|nr:alpha/beta hydrolase [Rhodoferax sp.]MDD5332458.1 alpha/beta hydrolase [Rhodoferax sp.]
MLFSLLSITSCAWLDGEQRQIIYRPTQGVPTDFMGLRSGDERYFVNVPPTGHNPIDAVDAVQRVEIWWLPHANKNAPTLLYFHGTFRTLFQNMRKIEALREAGFAVLAVEYRGWGLSTPITPSEQTILQDAAVAWAELQRREPHAGQRVIYGHSMGSGVAVDLASRLQPRLDYGALILESAFTSFADVAREGGLILQFLSYLNNERFASIEKIALVGAPLLMIHGSADSTIPVRLGEKLFAAANPPKLWLGIEAGAHSDLDQVGHAQYQATLRSFIKKYLSAKQVP